MIQILFKFKVQQQPKRALLFIKGQLIWAAHGRVITFRVPHELQKTWQFHKNMYNLQHHCRDQMIQILFKFKVQQQPKRALLFIKGQLIWAAHGRVITFRVLDELQKTWQFHKNMYNLQHHCRDQMRQILFKFKVQQHPKPVLLFIKGKLIWAANGIVISFRVLHDLQKTCKNCIKICNFATSL